ncbi:MAG: tRNA (guanosine(37)-N1)-methyltransferase TrmD [Candidatus Adiutrix sp.]|jgi:tRNA (guanine37-N1)-methyltransferase|nr:tRNA (guanosine(37)-N1)-methyltransferase TrmD [Candidatus Adiutrix sp.]
MRFDLVTLFPDIFGGFLSEALMAKALARGVIQVTLTNPRDFAPDRHRTCDDRPYGGGPGMVLKPEPLALAIEAAGTGLPRPWRICLTPSGTRLDQAKVRELLARERLLIICGRYEGFDQRLIDLLADEEISIGDYVVNGGEVPAMVLMEAVARLTPGFMGRTLSAEEESHQAGLLEYPHYTRPPSFRGLDVPGILLSGHHQAVAEWRLAAAVAKTLDRRPEMLASDELTPALRAALAALSRPAAPGAAAVPARPSPKQPGRKAAG